MYSFYELSSYKASPN
jgi:hypothetical protein